MNAFEPIAIVGRACILPGAQNPAALWDLVTTGRIALSAVPEGRWGVPKSEIMGALIASDRGGYVTDFAPAQSSVSGEIAELERLDPSVAWLLACAKAAVAEAGLARAPETSALIIGNLSYPTDAMTRFVEAYWLCQQGAERAEEFASQDPRNRFCSGLPVHLVAQALGIKGPAFALDAACASSLYAMKLACDRLHDRAVDFALAGGLARADDLFIHLGFTALQALSPSGRSRPFHKEADGLVPAEGAALVALKRLSDAIAGGDRIFGVIRAIGLSNDGRQNGFLAPAVAGQIAAMRAAYEQSGLAPDALQYVECHATGTVRGDAIEVESLGEVWGRAPKPALGSLKSNIGHTITASGAASLIKMLGAFEAGVLPPSVCEAPIAAAREAGFAVPTAPASWDVKGPRRAAISNFGFGGNNAHLIVEEWTGEAPRAHAKTLPRAAVAVVGFGVIAGEARGQAAFARRLLAPRETLGTRTNEIALALEGLAFPPNDLKASLAQQTGILAAVEEALAQSPALPPGRTGIFIGMGCDTTVARHGLRLKIARMLGLEAGAEADAWRAANEQAAPRLTAAGVLGTMPNIPANRVHAAKNFTGWGFTVASEELSGVAALEIAMRALRVGELDAALVGAADFSCEPVHVAAMRQLVPQSTPPGDAAIVLVLMRAKDAEAQGARVLALIDEPSAADEAPEPVSEVEARFGHSHAAAGLLEVAARIVELAGRARVDEGGAWPALGDSGASTVRARSFSGQAMAVGLVAPASPVGVPFLVPRVATFAANDRQALIARIAHGEAAVEGRVRLALIADDGAALEKLKGLAIDALNAGKSPAGPGIHFAEAVLGGEIAFAFTGAAAIYPNAAREFLLAFPEVGDAIADRFGGTRALARTLHGPGVAGFTPTTQLTGCALVCQAHAEFTRNILGLQPSAAIGLSSGETNALLAFGVWRDLDAMLAEIDASGLYDPELTGECLAAREYWRLKPADRVDWRCWRIAAPVTAVREALIGEKRCYLTIIHAPEDCVIGGDAAACARVIERIGKSRALALGLDMIVHCPVLEPFSATWKDIHTRENFAAPGVRFYSNADNRAYVPTRETAAAAITRQALETIDFPKTILQAYADGVRVFIEHGPRGILTAAIGRILEGRPHLAVALDRREKFGLKGLAASVLQLWVAGVGVALGAFTERLATLAPKAGEEKRLLKLPAHPPDIVFPETEVHAAPRAALAAEPRSSPKTERMAPPDEARAYDFASVLGAETSAVPVAVPRLLEPIPAAANAREGAIMRLFSDVSVAHREYLARQKSLHEQFLAVHAGGQDRTLTFLPRLRGRSGEAGALGAASAPATTAWSPSPINGGGKITPITRSAPPPPALSLSREQLLIHASGRISEIFGPAFARQDGFARQVRMPEPPLLLADRASALEGEPGAMGKGRVVTETDVAPAAWYLHQGRMAPGTVIEAGQADLLLISWLGADFLNQGNRVYRLLGCDLTFFGGLPKPGETLTYDIHIDGHAKTGDVRLFFFHYDCRIGDRLLLSVRDGQAGFFTDAELATSGGVLWDAADDPPKEDARLDPPPRVTAKRTFTREEVDAFRAGDAYACFGAGFERAAAHTRTPTIGSGRLGLIDEVAEFDPAGGPWGRGYLRARSDVPTDAWFYKGHFKNDPCMPGTLMADAATQALGFAMAAMGFSIERDGWRFEPVPEETAKFVCRGQVTPDRPHTLDYEVFIEEIIGGETPMVFAALLCKSDGFKVFGCRRFGLRLVPDWPLTTMPEMLPGLPAPRRVGGDVRGDEAALLACAWGRPSDAFGALYKKFDGAARAPRLPGPPYHFLTRIVAVEGEPGLPRLGASVVAEYDVPADAWYFVETGGQMPLAVLTEVLLQPCGWLASYFGFAANRAGDVLFRNLDGDEAVLRRAVTGAGTLKVTACLERFAQAGGSTIVFFTVVCEDAAGPVMTLKTDFGFFEPKALAAQVGLPVTGEMRARLAQPSAHGGMALAAALALLARLDRLKMLDEITGYWPRSASSGARIRARQKVEPGAWYFKAHFYQDPVQPGSLGLEALVELAHGLLLIERPDLAGAAFEPIAIGEPFAWRFRGQVTPASREVVTEVECVEVLDEPGGALMRARGILWVDGLRIYEMPLFAVRARRPS